MEERSVFVTTDGDEIVVRPIRPDDAPALVDFHEHLSAETIYLRFFSSHTHLRPAEVERFIHVDGHDRFAVVAEHGGAMVAVARYDRLKDPRTAEVAFVVADAWQHHGIGSFLLRACWPGRPGPTASTSSWPKCSWATGPCCRCSPSPDCRCATTRPTGPWRYASRSCRSATASEAERSDAQVLVNRLEALATGAQGTAELRVVRLGDLTAQVTQRLVEQRSQFDHLVVTQRNLHLTSLGEGNPRWTTPDLWRRLWSLPFPWGAEHAWGMDIHLTDDEAANLRQTLAFIVDDIDTDIQSTNDLEWRGVLRQRRDHLDYLRRELAQAAELGDSR